MLAEWFKHLRTPAPPHLKAMGYVKELIAVEARHRRCAGAWAPHLETCRKLIGDAARDAGHGRVTVLGSGLLLDVPVDELAGLFKEVILVDIFHMPAIQERVRAHANVRLVTADVTGVVEATWNHVAAGSVGPLPPPQADASAYADSDLVVSANLLTQLPLLPLGLVQKKGRGYGEEETQAFARRIVENHLELLAALPGRVTVLTETQRVICDGPEVLHEIDPLFGAALPAAAVRKHWTWNIAPRPEINRKFDLRFRMTGIPDLQEALP
ncbi:MAG: hypothetical protein IIC55_09410 [Proteobacteria bacterium]|nr:hypothetical protein [Pseudomonadota bacterium]